jgi:vacuolar iron transporter family protein
MKYKKEILTQQRNELTEYFIYEKLAKLSTNLENKKILEKIADDEKKHFEIWRKITGEEVRRNIFKIYFYIFLAKVLGLSFSLKLMESWESTAQKFYQKVSNTYPIAKEIWEDEKEHELKLIRILKDKRVTYAGSIVLWLNDALVELTWTLAGLTLTFNNAKIIWITGLIMWIAASLSMASSGYLASREEEKIGVNPIKAAAYTWIAYIVTVILLVIPYLIFENVYVALGVMLSTTIFIIASYTIYISIAKEVPFKRRFLEMATISLWVALISYFIGYVVKVYFWIEI